MTWFRGEEGAHWIDATADPLPEALALVREFLRSAPARSGTARGAVR
jgi:hypothetical protein